jgi:hypothetical protein
VASDGSTLTWRSGALSCPAGKVIVGVGQPLLQRADFQRLSFAEWATIQLWAVETQNISGTGSATVVVLINNGGVSPALSAFRTIQCANATP